MIHEMREMQVMNMGQYAHGNQPGHCYIKDMKVNGKSYSRNYLTHEQLTRGANIQFQMSPVPNKQRGTTEKDVPYSLSFE